MNKQDREKRRIIQIEEMALRFKTFFKELYAPRKMFTKRQGGGNAFGSVNWNFPEGYNAGLKQVGPKRKSV